MLKKQTLLLLFSLTLFSCKKNYTCECIVTDSYGDTAPPTTFVIHDTKKNAETRCENQITLEDLYPDEEVTTDCHLK